MARRRFTRKRIEGILRDVADAITYGGGDEEEIADVRALTSVLTALRGPDGIADDRQKKAVTTAMIRGAIASYFFPSRIPTNYYNNSGLDIERFDGGRFSTRRIRSSHFASHIADARDALYRFGIIEQSDDDEQD